MYAMVLCGLMIPAADALPPPKGSEFIELFVDRDPEVIQLRARLLAAEAKLASAERHLYSNDPVVALAKGEVRQARQFWERRRCKVHAGIAEILQMPNGMDILLKLYGDKKP